MATLYTQQYKNVSKTWFLMAVFLALVVAIGYFASFYYNSPGILYFAIIFSVVMNIVGYWNSDKIALSMAGAKLADESGVLPDTVLELKRTVETLAITAGLPSPKVYIINDQSPNAFATGRNKEHGAIAVTTGLLKIMNKTELEGVLAHEMSHIGNRDTLLSTAVVILVGLISIMSDIMVRSRFIRSSDEDNRSGGIFMIVGLILVILSPIIATIIQLAISRKREFLADATGALMTRYPEGLASALEKIKGYEGMPLKHATNAMAHLYISNPFGAKALNGISKLFMTHPPLDERIKILRDMV